MFTILEPEVAGGLGDGTILDASTHPPMIRRLEYAFDGWLGDDLLESFPVFIVSQWLKTAVAASTLTGYAFADVAVTKTETLEELYPDRDLPAFAWLQVSGRASQDDFGLADDHRLVVSEQALALLQQFQLDHCIMNPYS